MAAPYCTKVLGRKCRAKVGLETVSKILQMASPDKRTYCNSCGSFVVESDVKPKYAFCDIECESVFKKQNGITDWETASIAETNVPMAVAAQSATKT